MFRRTYLVVTFAIALLNVPTARAKDGGSIANVSVSPAFFNPSLGQKEAIHFSVPRQGLVSISILDRDRFVIRHLPDTKVAAGANTVAWDGKDDAGAIVPDEAYAIRIKPTLPEFFQTYDPGQNFQSEPQEISALSYSRTDGVLSYRLPWAGRIHVEVGEAVPDPKTGKLAGPVLRTLVDDEPRVAGTVAEKWNGFDASGAIYVPDLPHFALVVMATRLPDNSIITVGNRHLSFFGYAMAHRPKSATRPRRFSGVSHVHHVGLTALEDRTPTVVLLPSGRWNKASRTWQVGRQLSLKVSLGSKNDGFFLAQPGELDVYLDGTQVSRKVNPHAPSQLSVDLRGAKPGRHRITVNWSSELGPTAANSIAVEVDASSALVERSAR